jgi:hypothetical protein
MYFYVVIMPFYYPLPFFFIVNDAYSYFLPVLFFS